DVDAVHQFDAELDVRGFVTGFELALHAVEQRRRNREEAFGRIVVGNRPDMRIDAEDLRRDHDGAARGVAGLGDVGVEAMAVGCGKLDMTTHDWSPCRCCTGADPGEYPFPAVPGLAGDASMVTPTRKMRCRPRPRFSRDRAG